MIGLGVSSFSHFGGVHFQNAHSFEEYMALLEMDQLPLLRALSLTPKQKVIREMILISLKNWLKFYLESPKNMRSQSKDQYIRTKKLVLNLEPFPRSTLTCVQLLLGMNL